jgi:putative FmdB family regulatory protein
MPTYDYTCDACQHTFEIFEPITAEPQKKCPKCKKKKLRRLFGAGAALVFKGSGFYQTDYRSDSYKKAAAAEKPPAESATSSGDGAAKTESKSESKSDSSSRSESKPTTSAKTEKKSRKPES